MVRDWVFTGLAVVWVFLDFKAGDTTQAVVWFSIFFYAVTTGIENRLRD